MYHVEYTPLKVNTYPYHSKEGERYISSIDSVIGEFPNIEDAISAAEESRYDYKRIKGVDAEIYWYDERKYKDEDGNSDSLGAYEADDCHFIQWKSIEFLISEHIEELADIYTESYKNLPEQDSIDIYIDIDTEEVYSDYSSELNRRDKSIFIMSIPNKENFYWRDYVTYASNWDDWADKHKIHPSEDDIEDVDYWLIDGEFYSEEPDDEMIEDAWQIYCDEFYSYEKGKEFFNNLRFEGSEELDSSRKNIILACKDNEYFWKKDNDINIKKRKISLEEITKELEDIYPDRIDIDRLAVDTYKNLREDETIVEAILDAKNLYNAANAYNKNYKAPGLYQAADFQDEEIDGPKL
jgi:hypothetical protein